MKHQRTRQTDRKIHWTEVEPPSVFLSVVIRAYQTVSPNISHSSNDLQMSESHTSTTRLYI